MKGQLPPSWWNHFLHYAFPTRFLPPKKSRIATLPGCSMWETFRWFGDDLINQVEHLNGWLNWTNWRGYWLLYLRSLGRCWDLNDLNNQKKTIWNWDLSKHSFNSRNMKTWELLGVIKHRGIGRGTPKTSRVFWFYASISTISAHSFLALGSCKCIQTQKKWLENGRRLNGY